MDLLPLDPSLLDRAVDWRLRTMAEDSDMEEWNAYEVWLASSPAHVEAAGQVDQLLALLDDYALNRSTGSGQL